MTAATRTRQKVKPIVAREIATTTTTSATIDGDEDLDLDAYVAEFPAATSAPMFTNDQIEVICWAIDVVARRGITDETLKAVKFAFNGALTKP